MNLFWILEHADVERADQLSMTMKKFHSRTNSDNILQVSSQFGRKKMPSTKMTRWSCRSCCPSRESAEWHRSSMAVSRSVKGLVSRLRGAVEVGRHKFPAKRYQWRFAATLTQLVLKGSHEIQKLESNFWGLQNCQCWFLDLESNQKSWTAKRIIG